MQVACVLRTNCAQFARNGCIVVVLFGDVLWLHAHPVAGPARWCRMPALVSPTARAALEVGPVVDLEECPTIDLVAEYEACLGKFGDGRRDRALSDLLAHPKARRSDSLRAALKPTLVIGLGDEPIDQQRGRYAARLEKLVSAELGRHPARPGRVVARTLAIGRGVHAMRSPTPSERSVSLTMRKRTDR